VYAASLAEPALAELQDRDARMLGTDSIRMTIFDVSIRQRRTGIIITGLASLANISSLLYALIH
jgi:hypothetical protein